MSWDLRRYEIEFRIEFKIHYLLVFLGLGFNDDQVNHFEIYQNNENVYSYGNCKTVGPVSDYYKEQVKDEKCHNYTTWKFNVSFLFILWLL